MDEMIAYSQDGKTTFDIEDCTEDKGRLEKGYRTIVHEAIEGSEGKGHYETVAEYPNGGKDIKWVWDEEPVQAEEEWIEKRPCYIFIPYSEEEIAELEARKREEERRKAKIPYLEKIDSYKIYLADTDYCVIKAIELGSTIQEMYPEVAVLRAEARARINELKAIL